MSWVVITLDTVKEDKVADLVDACDTAALGAGQDPRSPAIIQGVVDEVRRKVESCRANRVDSDITKIPKGMRNLAVTLIIARLKNAIEQPLTEDERTELARCERNLNRVASCDDVVDQPDDPVESTAEAGTGSPAITPKTRRFTQCSQDGI